MTDGWYMMTQLQDPLAPELRFEELGPFGKGMCLEVEERPILSGLK
jgi:hypothetical protein